MTDLTDAELAGIRERDAQWEHSNGRWIHHQVPDKYGRISVGGTQSVADRRALLREVDRLRAVEMAARVLLSSTLDNEQAAWEALRSALDEGGKERMNE